MARRYTIGVMIGNANSPHTMDMMRGIYHSAEKLQVDVLFFLGIHSQYYYRSYFGDNAGDDYDYQFNVVYDYTFLAKVDALIIAFGTLSIFMEDADKETFLKRFEGIPYVLVEEKDETQGGTSLIADNYNCMYDVVEHLVRDHGYRDFTYLSGPHANTDAKERKNAFLDVMKKYNIPFDMNRIEYGDYSSCVEEQVNRLLDDYPDMEAMVCANDIMANTAYRECTRRGRTVGQNIAITGFDDWDIAESMNPPLTTVHQNSYDMGYMALTGALELIEGANPRSIIVPSLVKYRSSCGCGEGIMQRDSLSLSQKGDRSADEFARKATDQILDRISLANSNRDISDAIRFQLQQLFAIDFTNPENKKQFLLLLSHLLESEAGEYISSNTLLRILNNYFSEWISETMVETDVWEKEVTAVLDLKDDVQDMVFSHMCKSTNDRYDTYEKETWFLPLISRDMMDNIDDEAEFYRNGMLKLCALKARSSYLYIFERPIAHRAMEPWARPEKMYLAASQEGSEIRSYLESERPVLTRENGIGAFHSLQQQYTMSVFCLFAGEMQYGMLVTEIDPANFGLFHLISMQIGNALRFHELSKQQRETQKRLEQLVKEINAKNEVLNFLSEYDVLTGCLNRRGFMEKAVTLNQENTGEQAVIIFADLDHLKEINDTFGHKEGDFAIIHCAEVMQEAIGDSGVVGRIGGDEFVAFLLCPDEEQVHHIIDHVKHLNEEFNAASDKEFYVELSMGHQHFACSSDISISELLDDADHALYDAKKKRRKTIQKK